MVGLYAIGIRCYGWLIRLAALWQPKAKAWITGRRHWQAELKQAAPPNGFDLWMHCASLGEFEQGRPILEGYRKKYKDHNILLTFYSPSGYEIRKNYDQVNHVTYLPLDSKRNCRDFLALTNPQKSLFVKYDCWPNMMLELIAQKRTALLIAAQFRNTDLYHGALKNWTRPLLQAFQKIYLQKGPKLSWLSTEQQIAGDPRADRVLAIQQNSVIDPQLSAWATKKIMVWGSVWPKDWAVMQAVLQGPLADWQHLIAPHDIAKDQVEALLNFLGREASLYTSPTAKKRLLILDTMGQLSSAYRIGEMAYIGGGFGNGIHNILEPLAAGLPTFFGPRHDKFPEAAEAIDAACGFEVGAAEVMIQQMRPLLSPPNLLATQKKAHQFIAARAGATEIILGDI